MELNLEPDSPRKEPKHWFLVVVLLTLFWCIYVRKPNFFDQINSFMS